MGRHVLCVGEVDGPSRVLYKGEWTGRHISCVRESGWAITYRV